MADYKLIEDGVYQYETGYSIPNAPGNRHWREYLEYVDGGGLTDQLRTPEEALGEVIGKINGKNAERKVSGMPRLVWGLLSRMATASIWCKIVFWGRICCKGACSARASLTSTRTCAATLMNWTFMRVSTMMIAVLSASRMVRCSSVTGRVATGRVLCGRSQHRGTVGARWSLLSRSPHCGR